MFKSMKSRYKFYNFAILLFKARANDNATIDAKEVDALKRNNDIITQCHDLQ